MMLISSVDIASLFNILNKYQLAQVGIIGIDLHSPQTKTKSQEQSHQQLSGGISDWEAIVSKGLLSRPKSGIVDKLLSWNCDERDDA